MAKKYPPPSPPFIRARNQGGRQTPKAIVMHGTVSSDNAGTARNIARWWNGPGSPMSSCHYVTDPKEVIQCVGDHSVAYHCGYNYGSIGVELCDEQTGPASRWEDADSRAILRRAARLVAELCLAYNIKPVRPTIADLKRKGPHGIYGHNDSRLAFGRTSHTDPRDFNWPRFLQMVREEIADIKDESKPGGNTGTRKDKMRPEAYFVGAKGPHVRWLANRLVKHGYKRFYKNGVDKTFTAGEDRKALAAFQRAQGWKGEDANGLPGPETLKRLKAKPKPKHSGGKPNKPKKTERIHLMHVSMQRSDSSKQQRHDAKEIFRRAKNRNVAWVTGTEAGTGSGQLAKILRREARRKGYRFKKAGGGAGAWVAVRKSFIDGGYRTFYKKVLDGRKGQYPDSGIVGVKFRNKNLGRIAVLASHYVTRGRPGAKNPAYRRRVAQNRRLARALGSLMRKHAKGSALGFYGGDQNIVDRHDDTFMGQPITSIQDELGKWPNTGHGPIDVIGSFDRDGRVEPAYVWSLNDKEFFLHTDHFVVEAAYDVELLKG